MRTKVHKWVNPTNEIVKIERQKKSHAFTNNVNIYSIYVLRHTRRILYFVCMNDTVTAHALHPSHTEKIKTENMERANCFQTCYMFHVMGRRIIDVLSCQPVPNCQFSMGATVWMTVWGGKTSTKIKSIKKTLTSCSNYCLYMFTSERMIIILKQDNAGSRPRQYNLE